MNNKEILLLIDKTGTTEFSQLLQDKSYLFDVRDWTTFQGEHLDQYQVVIFISDGTILNMPDAGQTALVEAVVTDAVALIVFEFATYCVSNNTLQILKEVFPLTRVSGWTESVKFTENPDYDDVFGFLEDVALPFEVFMSGSQTLLNANGTSILYMKDTAPAIAIHNDYRVLHFTMCPTYISSSYFNSWSISGLRKIMDNALALWLGDDFRKTDIEVDDRSLIADLRIALEDESLSDIVFVTSDAKSIFANKWFLCLRSVYFKSLLDGPMAESEMSEIEVDDTAFTFKALIEYLYQDQVNLKQYSVSQIIDIYKIADKYLCPGLKNHCEKCLTVRINKDTIFEVIFNIEVESTRLKYRIARYFWTHYNELIKRREIEQLREMPEWQVLLEKPKRGEKKIHDKKCALM
jgi:hypothetical protein